MNATLTRYRAAGEPLGALLAALPAGAWGAPSPCEGWAARDVVRHLVDTQREFLAGRGVELGPAPDVDADPAGAWARHAGAVEAALADEAVAAAPFDGYFGPTTTGETLERFYVWDMVVHRWDVATAAGLDAGLSEEELDRVEEGAAGFGEALYLEGVCRPGVQAPAGAGRAARVLARLGRRA
ncbi:maleylpyruvate isomerase family mycothiol-dependent enzyme [Vallicoccus soli]|uniref:Maleylpyruvate isomerase family mycothiol-dependent enzyme n=1 Tax=Vallicoccus soli TaxID=2339232 RepID=A0A3A3YXN3_9ACTN|nr:maleylpyruvate isomerase family mycothiol-dependent enzyme [Vallicoccus soli]RJK93833.1 maleylpyruvate isomerase family mycothiol-dependent enzyme [Vallicoccus soli]